MKEQKIFSGCVVMHLSSRVYLGAHLELSICGPPGRTWRGMSYTFLLPFDLVEENNISKPQTSSLGSLSIRAS